LAFSVVLAGTAMLIAGYGRVWRSRGNGQATASVTPEACSFEYVTAPLVPQCAEQLARFSAEVPQMNDQAVPVDHVSVTPRQARDRFGMNTDVAGNVEVVLLDIWPRHTLDRFNPTNPAAPGTPPPSYQQLSAVFVEPGGAVRVRHTEELTGTRKTSVYGIYRASIAWD
jgi:hypothetical protein